MRAEQALKQLVELVGLDEAPSEVWAQAPDEGDLDFPCQGASIGSLRPIMQVYERLEAEADPSETAVSALGGSKETVRQAAKQLRSAAEEIEILNEGLGEGVSEQTQAFQEALRNNADRLEQVAGIVNTCEDIGPEPG